MTRWEITKAKASVNRWKERLPARLLALLDCVVVIAFRFGLWDFVFASLARCHMSRIPPLDFSAPACPFPFTQKGPKSGQVGSSLPRLRPFSFHGGGVLSFANFHLVCTCLLWLFSSSLHLPSSSAPLATAIPGPRGLPTLKILPLLPFAWSYIRSVSGKGRPSPPRRGAAFPSPPRNNNMLPPFAPPRYPAQHRMRQTPFVPRPTQKNTQPQEGGLRRRRRVKRKMHAERQAYKRYKGPLSIPPPPPPDPNPQT